MSRSSTETKWSARCTSTDRPYLYIAIATAITAIQRGCVCVCVFLIHDHRSQSSTTGSLQLVWVSWTDIVKTSSFVWKTADLFFFFPLVEKLLKWWITLRNRDCRQWLPAHRSALTPTASVLPLLWMNGNILRLRMNRFWRCLVNKRDDEKTMKVNQILRARLPSQILMLNGGCHCHHGKRNCLAQWP